jgi:hypothetical protein
MLLLSLKFALLVGHKLLIISFFMINLLVAKSWKGLTFMLESVQMKKHVARMWP